MPRNRSAPEEVLIFEPLLRLQFGHKKVVCGEIRWFHRVRRISFSMCELSFFEKKVLNIWATAAFRSCSEKLSYVDMPFQPGSPCPILEMNSAK